jgi:DNA polymerase/3'-5' exonuclease PolX
MGNAETIYYVREEDMELIGINKSIASNMSILLSGRQVKKINYLSKPEAVLYPARDLSVEDQFLKDFKWITGQRPASKNDIFIWEVPESEN